MLSNHSRQILLKAADRFEAHPELWRKGGGYYAVGGEPLSTPDRSDDPSLICSCIVLAIDRLIHLESVSHWDQRVAAQETIAAIAGDLGYENHREIYKWNDSPERTVEDVIALLRKVAND